MGTKIVYTQKLIDARELGAADLKKFDVEGFKHTVFANGVAVEVDDEVAEAILDNPDVFGQFELADEEDLLEPEEDEPVEKKQAPKDAAKSGGTSQESTGDKSVTKGSSSTAGTASAGNQ